MLSAGPATGNGFLYSTASGGSGPSGANRVSLPSSVVDVIAMNQTQLIRLVQPARLIYAELQLLDMLGFPPDIPEPWWDVIVW